MTALQIGPLPRLAAPTARSRFSGRGGRRSTAIGLPSIRASAETTAEKITAAESKISVPDEAPSVDFAFVSSRLFPDGSPDVQIRSAVGGKKLRDIMLDGHIDLYGPYARPLLNCGGGGTCATCLVEVLEGTELLSPRTEKEKEALKKKPKNWRLACQTMVGSEESRGQIIIQQLPEWKAHEWQK
ncbi:NDH-dependent cyclic electron flow 1 [Wolffia australiana]